MDYSLGKIIRDARIAKGLTPVDIALFSGTFIHDYFKLEDDYHLGIISADSLMRIIYLLDLPVEKFIEDYTQATSKHREGLFKRKLNRIYDRTINEAHIEKSILLASTSKEEECQDT